MEKIVGADMEIIGRKKIFLGISGTLVLLSWASLAVFGLKPGMDFTGGSLWEVKVTGIKQEEVQKKIEDALQKSGVDKYSIQPTDSSTFIARFKDIPEEKHQELKTNVEIMEISSADIVGEELRVTGKQAKLEELRFESIGPSIGKELKEKAYVAISLVLLFIVIYIAWAFRKVSEPVSSWKYGAVAIIALIHDVSIPTGIMSVLGRFKGYEVDTLFVTALLTVLGFSVHDTIVVFDRIRENLAKFKNEVYSKVVNKSVNDTMARSINTSLTALIVLFALYLFGGHSIRNFVLVLILGIFFGTYSSIFVASPLVVLWHERKLKKEIKTQGKAKK